MVDSKAPEPRAGRPARLVHPLLVPDLVPYSGQALRARRPLGDVIHIPHIEATDAPVPSGLPCVLQRLPRLAHPFPPPQGFGSSSLFIGPPYVFDARGGVRHFFF